MGFFNNLFMTVVTGVNYFNRDEWGAIRNGSYTPPEVTHVTTDWRGYPEIHVKADNYVDAADTTKGTTYPGDVFRTVEHQQGRDWVIRVNPFRTEKNERPGETQQEYQERIDKERGVSE